MHDQILSINIKIIMVTMKVNISFDNISVMMLFWRWREISFQLLLRNGTMDNDVSVGAWL